MRNVLFLLLFFVSIDNINSQPVSDKTIDSLLVRLNNTKNNLVRLRTLHMLSESLVKNYKYEKATVYSKEALNMSLQLLKENIKSDLKKKLEIKNLVGQSYYNSGNLNLHLFKYTEAISDLTNSIKYWEETNNKLGLANAHNSIGRLKYFQGNNSEAERYFKKSLEISESAQYLKGTGEAIKNLATFDIIKGNYTEALKNLNNALVINKKTGNSEALIRTYINFSFYHIRRNELNEAMKYLQETIKLSQAAGDKQALADAYGNLGNVNRTMGNISEALKNHFNCLQLNQETGNKLRLARVHSNISTIYYDQLMRLKHEGARKESRDKKIDESLNHLFTSMKLSEEIEDKKGIALCNQNIGVFYREKGKYSEALLYIFKALKINQELGDKISTASTYVSLATVYTNLKDYDEATKYYLESQRIYAELGNKQGQISGSHNAGDVYLNKARSVRDSNEANKYFSLALENMQAAIHLAQEEKDSHALVDAYEGMEEIFHTMQNYPKAYEYAKMGFRLRDSLFGNEEAAKVEKLTAKFENEKILAEEKYKQEKALQEEKLITEKALKEKEVEKLKYESRLTELRILNDLKIAEQKFNADKLRKEEKDRSDKEKFEAKRKTELLILSSAILVIVLVFSFLYLRQRTLKQRAVERADAVHKMAELELQSLRAQLNPHFMFNSLNAIQELILMEDNERSHEYLSTFAGLLRKLLDNANKPFVLLNNEIEFLRQYLSLEKLRIPDMKYTIEIDPQIDMEKIKVPNMMLQPYIENAIWHGLSPKQGNKKLEIRIVKQNGSLQYEIEDNGIGRKKAEEMRAQQKKGYKSKGMELLSKRFRLLGDEFGTEISVTTSDVTNNGNVEGTKVSIIVPMELTEKTKEIIS
jgi:tetratricopeptide (TPR) repeat protein